MRLVETPEDRAVKERFWATIERELLRYAGTHAARHIRGQRESERQRDIVVAAKQAGFPMGLVRKLSSLIRRNEGSGEAFTDAVSRYRFKLGLVTSHA